MSDHTWTENCTLCGGSCKLGKGRKRAAPPPPPKEPEPTPTPDTSPPSDEAPTAPESPEPTDVELGDIE